MICSCQTGVDKAGDGLRIGLKNNGKTFQGLLL